MKTFVSIQEHPKNYFDLIQQVGSKGKYQQMIFIVLALNWYVAAMLLMGTSLLYLNPPLQCPASMKLTQAQCHNFVCDQPPQKWGQYIEPKLAQSLSTEFGPYQCSDEKNLNFLRSTLYVGVLFGYMTFLFFADNFGRKFSLILTWVTTTIGLGILAGSWSMEMANFGLFLAGAGCQSSIRIGMSLLGQVVEYNLRQKFSVGLQSAFGISGVCIGILFYSLKNWRIIITFFCFLPSLIVLLLFVTTLQETPKFLLQKGADKALKALNKIAALNEAQRFLTFEDIKPYLQRQTQEKKYINMLDFFRYPSLRGKTFIVCLLFFALTYAYIGPIVIVDKLGFSPFRSQIIVSAAEIIVYPITFCIIDLLPRRRSATFLMGLASLFTGILIFVRKPLVCDECFEGNLQIVMVFCARFCIAMYFAIFFLYCTELYPLPARALGFGIGSSAGALASTSSQVIMPLIQQHGWNPMILLTFMSFSCIFLVKFLPETLNMPLQEQLYYEQESASYENESRQMIEDKWSFHGSLYDESKIMGKTIKMNLQTFLRIVFPHFRGFNRISQNEEIDE